VTSFLLPLLAESDGLPARELIAQFGYLTSVILFIVSIQRMSRVKSARAGNHMAAFAMLLAIVCQFVEMGSIQPGWIIGGLAVGAVAGVWLGVKVKMTQMPEMVALLNGLGGLASMLVGIGSYLVFANDATARGQAIGTLGDIGGAFNGVNLMLTVLVGAVTFTGSVIAYLKLAEKMPGKPILFPGRHLINGGMFLASLLISILVVWTVKGSGGAMTLICLTALLALALGVGLVIPIGGGDMPVIISLLNSYSGVAGALAGFTINEPVLIVAGSLVGASGIILTKIMCKAMNRSLMNVVFGGFGAEPAAGAGAAPGKDDGYKNVKSADAEEAALVLADARSCIIVPGYGMAVAQAQHAVRELADLLEKRGCTVRYAVHPVAGRMPGHMNVLLAEANVPYDRLFEMDAIDGDFKNTDAVIVIGANDVVNPAAKTNPQSPLYGMPVLSCEEARTVFVIKRSLGAGFAGVKNELFEYPNTRMIYMDAKKACEELAKAIKES